MTFKSGWLRFILLTCIMSCMLQARSQVVIVPELPTAGIIMKPQLWSVIINNLSGEVQKASLQITVTDRATSAVVMEAHSSLMMLNTGVNRVGLQQMSPVQYTITNIGFADAGQSNLPIPVGEFLVCYKLYKSEASANDILTSECITVYSEPLSPPQLIQPSHEEVLKDSRPLFTWTPPAPIHMFNSLSYQIIVTPVFERQSPEEALQRNVPFLTSQATNNSLAYPSGFRNLEQGKTYAWQVSALDAGRYGGKSEVWTFTLLPDSVLRIIQQAPFIKLKKDNSQATVLHQNSLKLEYFNSNNDTLLKLQVFRVKEVNSKRKEQEVFELKIRPGQNFLQYNLKKRLQNDEVYEVRAINNQQEIWMMRFTPHYYL